LIVLACSTVGLKLVGGLNGVVVRIANVLTDAVSVSHRLAVRINGRIMSWFQYERTITLILPRLNT
jgi:hypothetical protein